MSRLLQEGCLSVGVVVVVIAIVVSCSQGTIGHEVRDGATEGFACVLVGAKMNPSENAA